ncbi:MAG TPA: cation diffusion facilitator family transporter [Sulfuriferula sp.]|nr:cation diffusion facilitator family transporter [Sulfuriferula sp.]
MAKAEHTHQDHDHDHDHHGHSHHHHGHGGLGIAFWLTLGFAAVEAGGGWWSGSLALISDAGHMLIDALALGLAAFAGWLALRPTSYRHSYGLVRAEVVAALVNSVLMLALMVGIVWEAIARLHAPQPVQGGAVMVIAAIGLVVNIFVAYQLTRGEQTLNVRAALLHVLGDMLGSVAALVAGAVIYFTGWLPIDALLSLFVVALILVSSIRLLREALHILMEGVPHNLDLPEVGYTMAQMAGVTSVHDLHIWTLSSGKVALSAHLEIPSMQDWPRILHTTQQMLHTRFDIDHVTLQPELPAARLEQVGIPFYPRRSH